MKAAAVARFTQQVARRAQKNTEPNDRHYDRDVEAAVSRMRPEDVDRLLRDGDDDV
jgi:hypothetical protein